MTMIEGEWGDRYAYVEVTETAYSGTDFCGILSAVFCVFYHYVIYFAKHSTNRSGKRQ